MTHVANQNFPKTWCMDNPVPQPGLRHVGTFTVRQVLGTFWIVT